MKLPPYSYNISSVYSDVLGRYLNIIVMDENDTHDYVQEWPLERMDARNYIEMVAVLHLENPSTVEAMSSAEYTDFIKEIYEIMVGVNPCLQLGHIVKNRRVEKMHIVFENQ